MESTSPIFIVLVVVKDQHVKGMFRDGVWEDKEETR